MAIGNVCSVKIFYPQGSGKKPDFKAINATKKAPLIMRFLEMPPTFQHKYMLVYK